MSEFLELHFEITASEAGVRLDKFLAKQPEVGTRAKAQYLIDNNNICVDGKNTKASLVLKVGHKIDARIPVTPEPQGIIPLATKLDIVFEDEDVIVLNKPPGIVVHPSAGHEQDTLVNMLVAHTPNLSMKFNEMRPGIVHRIDKETSGLLLVAKNDTAHSNLTTQFKNRTINRKYEALCIGDVTPASGRIETILGRHPIDRKRFASQKSGEGKVAITHYKVLKTSHHLSLVELKLETGRTHQIRVHMTEKGFPLAGDNLYQYQKKMGAVKSKEIAAEIRGLTRFMLHARDLGFTHPKTGNELFFTVNWPEADLKWLQKLGFKT